MLRRLTIVVLLAQALGMLPAQAQGVVGYVAGIEGTQITLLRGEGSSRRLRLGENLMAGDTVVVIPPSKALLDTLTGSVELCIGSPPGGECRRRLTDTDGHRKATAIAERLWKMLAWYSPPSMELSTRDAEAAPAFRFSRTNQRIVAGERRLWVGWSGGRAPFTASIRVGDQTVAQSSSTERFVLMPSMRLSEGPITIVVADTHGRIATLPVTVTRLLPRVEDMSDRSINADHRVLLEAGELAIADSGAWVLEAIQRLEALVLRSQVANRMREQLAAGRSL